MMSWTRPFPLRLLAALFALGLVAAACGDDGDEETTTADDDTTTTVDDTTTTTGDLTPTTGGEDSTTTTAAVGEPVGDFSMDAVVTPEFPSGRGEITFLDDVRLGAQGGFDRVTFEFTDIVPAHQVRYVEPPIREDGSGNEVEVEGTAFLEVTMAAASGVDLSGSEPVVIYEGPNRLAIPESEVVTEAVRTGDFEAVLTWVIGLEARNGFAVDEFTDPSRLVIDIATG